MRCWPAAQPEGGILNTKTSNLLSEHNTGMGVNSVPNNLRGLVSELHLHRYCCRQPPRSMRSIYYQLMLLTHHNMALSSSFLMVLPLLVLEGYGIFSTCRSLLHGTLGANESVLQLDSQKARQLVCSIQV